MMSPLDDAIRRDKALILWNDAIDDAFKKPDDFAWLDMAKDIQKWYRECDNCCRSKIHKHIKSKIMLLPLARSFNAIHINLV